MHKLIYLIVLLIPIASFSQSRTWQAATDSTTGQKIYRWVDTGDLLSEPELRRLAMSDPALGITFPQDRIADPMIGAGLSFGLAIVSPSLVSLFPTDGITIEQLNTRKNVQVGLATGFSALGIVFTVISAQRLRAWRPLASPQGVGVSIDLK